MVATPPPPKSPVLGPLHACDLAQSLLDKIFIGEISLEQLQKMHEQIPPFLRDLFIEHMLFPPLPQIFSEHLRLLELEFDAEHLISAFTLRFENGLRVNIRHAATGISDKFPFVLLTWETPKEEE